MTPIQPRIQGCNCGVHVPSCLSPRPVVPAAIATLCQWLHAIWLDYTTVCYGDSCLAQLSSSYPSPLYYQWYSVAGVLEQGLHVLVSQVPGVVFSNLLDYVAVTHFSTFGCLFEQSKSYNESYSLLPRLQQGSIVHAVLPKFINLKIIFLGNHKIKSTVVKFAKTLPMRNLNSMGNNHSKVLRSDGKSYL